MADQTCPKIPHELLHRIIYRPTLSRDDMQSAAQWGWEQAMEQRSANVWPEPITDRPPTEADGDEHHKVQVQLFNIWETMSVEDAIKTFPMAGWHHTPRWRPSAPSVREKALLRIQELLGRGSHTWLEVQEVLKLAAQALEGRDG